LYHIATALQVPIQFFFAAEDRGKRQHMEIGYGA
jgi:hypothetical protein